MGPHTVDADDGVPAKKQREEAADTILYARRKKIMNEIIYYGFKSFLILFFIFGASVSLAVATKGGHDKFPHVMISIFNLSIAFGIASIL